MESKVICRGRAHLQECDSCVFLALVFLGFQIFLDTKPPLFYKRRRNHFLALFLLLVLLITSLIHTSIVTAKCAHCHHITPCCFLLWLHLTAVGVVKPLYAAHSWANMFPTNTNPRLQLTNKELNTFIITLKICSYGQGQKNKLKKHKNTSLLLSSSEFLVKWRQTTKEASGPSNSHVGASFIHPLLLLYHVR